MPTAFTFEPDRCTGCGACVVGCGNRHASTQREPWRRLHTFNERRQPGLPRFHLSLACHHCEAPACLENCPARAYTKDPVTGAVVIDPDRCIGCRYCTWACPHDAPRFHAPRGTIEKCTFCQERLVGGLKPACVEACPLEALDIAPLAGDSPSMPGVPTSSTRPALRVAPLRRGAPSLQPPPAPDTTWALRLLAVPEPKITLAGEWTLLVFTTTLALLAAWSLAAPLGGPALRPLPFLSAGALAMGLSTAHLGRPLRAWRALTHLRRSWLSREILLVSTFLGLGALACRFPGRALAWAAGTAGLLALGAIDRLYRVALKMGPLNLHSGQTLLNGLYVGGLLASLPALWLPTGALKLALYLHRKAHFHRTGQATRPAWTALRLALGFGLAPALALLGLPGAWAAAILGDLVDRGEFYGELAIPTPAQDLATRFRPLISRP